MNNLGFYVRVLACLMIVSVLITSGCRDKSSEQSDSNTADPTTTDSGMPEGRRPLDIVLGGDDVNEVAVTVNGVEVKESEINEIIAPELKMVIESSGASTLAVETLNEIKKQMRETVLQQLVVKRLLDPKIKEENIVVTEEDAEDLIKQQLSAQSPQVSIEDFKSTLEIYGRSYDGEIKRIQKELAYQKFIEAKITDQIQVTEKEAQKFYDENKKTFEVPERVRASHILVPTNREDPNEVRQKAKEKIDDLLQQVNEGADFAELAIAIGGFPSAPMGGDLGYFPRGEFEEPFEKVAFELETGKISDVVETGYGYHIIKVVDHKDAEILSFEEEKDNIIRYLTDQKKAEPANKYIESLVAEATIKFPEGKELKTGLFAP